MPVGDPDFSAPLSVTEPGTDPIREDRSGDLNEIDAGLDTTPDDSAPPQQSVTPPVEAKPAPKPPVTPPAEKIDAKTQEQKPPAVQQKTAEKPPEKPEAQQPPIEQKPPVKPATPATPPQTDKVEQPPEIKEPVGLSPNNRENWKALDTSRKEYFKNWKEADAKITAANKQVQETQVKIKELESGKALPEPIQNELKELRSFRSIHGMASAPEFINKFDNQIVSNLDRAYGILKQNGIEQGEGFANFITELKGKGGLLYGTWMQDDGKGGKVEVPFLKSNLWAAINEKLPIDQSTMLRKSIDDAIVLTGQRREAIQQMPQQVEEWQKDQQKQMFEKVNNYNTEVEKLGRSIQEANPWAQKIEPKGDEAPEKLAEIETHNKLVEDTEGRYRHIVTNLGGNPQLVAETAAAACFAFHYANMVENQEKEIADLKQQLSVSEANAQKHQNDVAKIKGAAQTTRAAAAAPPTNSKAAPKNYVGSGKKPEDELEEAMSEGGLS